jgi:hypothetical protein
MLYDMRRLVQDLRRSGRNAEASALEKICRYKVSYNPDKDLWTLMVTVPCLRTSDGPANQKLEIEGMPKVSLTQAVYPLDIERRPDGDVEFTIKDPTGFAVEYASIQSLIVNYAGLDATTADNIEKELQRWIGARWLKSTEGRRPPDLELTNEVSKWYKKLNDEHNVGSCMSKGEALKYIKMYDNNPNVVQLAIYRHKGKPVGRALVWAGKYYDRIYASSAVDDFTRALQANGLRPVNGTGIKFAAIMDVDVSNGACAPYLDTVSWGAMISDSQVLVATESARNSKEIEARLGVDNLSWVDYKTQNGGPFSVMCQISGSTCMRQNARQLGGLWFSSTYFSDISKSITVRFGKRELQIPYHNDLRTSTQTIIGLWTNLFNSTPYITGDVKTGFTITEAHPRDMLNGGVKLDSKGDLFFVYSDVNTGVSISRKISDLTPLGGSLGFYLDKESYAGYKSALLPVRDRDLLGYVPQVTARFCQRALANGVNYIPVGSAGVPTNLSTQKSGVLIA